MANESEWMDKDYYKVLGLGETASDSEIKKSYRKLAREYHPDVNKDPGAEDKFKDISEAYDVLSNPENRKKYDEIRAYAAAGGSPFMGGAGGSDGAGRSGYSTFTDGNGRTYSFGGVDPNDLNDFMGKMAGMFGDSFSTDGGPRRGSDPFGQYGDYRFDSSGASGRRRNLDVSASLAIDFKTAINGGVVKIDMNGSATKVKIPAGVDDGYVLKVPGKGESDGSRRGDLYMTLKVSGDPSGKWTRVGVDLTRSLPLTFSEATLGGVVEVKSWYGDKIKVKIPVGTKNGKRLRVSGKGLKTKRKTGDLYLVVEVVVPSRLSAEDKRKFEDLGSSLPSYSDKVKRMRM